MRNPLAFISVVLSWSNLVAATCPWVGSWKYQEFNCQSTKWIPIEVHHPNWTQPYQKIELKRDLSDQELAQRCEMECDMALVQCNNYCSNSACWSECARVFAECQSSCPCNDQCPNGCEDCPNPICVCGANPSPQNVDNLNNCTSVNSMDLGECILDCTKTGNKLCDESCVEDFRTQHQSCPCQVSEPYWYRLYHIVFMIY